MVYFQVSVWLKAHNVLGHHVDMHKVRSDIQERFVYN